MSEIQRDIAFYACVVCSVATNNATMSLVWLALALFVYFDHKWRQRRSAAPSVPEETK